MDALATAGVAVCLEVACSLGMEKGRALGGPMEAVTVMQAHGGAQLEAR